LKSRKPQCGAPLASQSTISRLENEPRKTEAARLTIAFVGQAGTTIRPRKQKPSTSTTHLRGARRQQLAIWNARHDERGFASMHIYHVGAPIWPHLAFVPASLYN
jgi:hypothetical protein